jgi:hypothetical protein
VALCKCAARDDRRYPFTEISKSALCAILQRGVFAKQAIPAGERVTGDERILRHSLHSPGQLVANDASKYTDFYATAPIAADQAAVGAANTRACHRLKQVYHIVAEVKKMLKRSKVRVPGQCELEISHHLRHRQFL